MAAVSDTVGVCVGVTSGTDGAEPASALGLMSTSISLSNSVWGVSGRCLEHSLSNGLCGASKIDRFPHPPSMSVVPVTGQFLLEASLDQSGNSSPSLSVPY